MSCSHREMMKNAENSAGSLNTILSSQFAWKQLSCLLRFDAQSNLLAKLVPLQHNDGVTYANELFVTDIVSKCALI